MNAQQYIIISTICLSIFYTVYLLALNNDANFKLLRFYLLASIFLSILMPMSNYRIHVDFMHQQPQPRIRTAINLEGMQGIAIYQNPGYKTSNPDKSAGSKLLEYLVASWPKLYFIISLILLARVFSQVSRLIYQFSKSERHKQGKYLIIHNTNFKNTFSFFNWIFVHPDNVLVEDIDQVILHEKVHASQYHSIDLIMIELLAAVMWFNPLVWSMRRSIQLVHEYLADEGALSTGIDKLRYQALLINQVTEEKLIRVSSNFNSLIKKRMIMITKSKLNHKTKLKILALVPVSALLFICIACVNGLIPVSALAVPKIPNGLSELKMGQNKEASEMSTPNDTIKKVKIQKKKKDKNTKEIQMTGYGNDSSKLIFIVDGVQVESDNVNQIMPDSIKSVNVLKDDNVVVIRTAHFSQKKPSIKLVSEKGDISKTIIFVDGVEQPSMDINSIDPQTIESMEVLKDESAKLMTNKKCDGVILIKTKKGKG
jgi:hypothetical protein